MAALFDLDGVLVDSRAAIAGCLNHALASVGLETRPAPDLHRLIGPPLHDAFAALLAGQEADPALVDVCVARYRERYRSACVEETLPVEGMAEALEVLAGRLPLAVATSKPVEFAGPILETLGLAGFFRSVAGPSLEARSEPKARTVGRALEALGVRAPNSPAASAVAAHAGSAAAVAGVAMVGDREHDVAAGRSHGLVTVGVTWGIGSASELRGAGAHHLVARPAGLVPLLAEPARRGASL